MKEKNVNVIWYRLRGLGLLGLCSFVFFVGAYLNNQRSITASNIVNGRRVPICSVETEGKKVALTFDAVWENGSSREILEILNAYQVKGTFFVTGEWASAYPEELRMIADSGHDIGTYGMKYAGTSQLTRTEINQSLEQVQNTVQDLTGIHMNLYRAPYDDYNNDVLEIAQMNDYLAVRWDVDSEDWKDYGLDAIISCVTQNKNLQNGSIIRMHSDAKYTAQSLEAVIMGLQDLGYELVPVSQLVYYDNYRITEEGKQIPN